MTKIKYFISALLIAICLFIVGEVQVMVTNFNLTSFENVTYRTGTMATQDSSQEVEELISILNSAYEETNSGIFVSKYETDSNLEQTKYLYCSENAKEYVENAIDGHTKYDSVLSGRLNYKVCSFEDIKSLGNTVTIYFCGNESDVSNAIKYISDSLPRTYEDEPSTVNIYKYIKLFAFGIAILLIVVFNIFDVNIKRKEFVIKCIYGESKYLLICKYLVTDVLLYGGEIFVMFCAISKLNSLFYCTNEVIIFSVCLLVGVVLSHIPLVKASPIYTLKGQENTRKLLVAGRVTKIMISILIICVTSFFVTLLIDLKTYIKTADFFESHSDYYFLYTESDKDMEDMLYNRDTYVARNYRIACEYYEICQPVLICNNMYATYDWQQEGANGYYVFANANAISYLKTVVKELNDATLQSDYIIIAPKSDCDNELIQKTIEEINCRYKKYIYDDVQFYNEQNVQIIKATENYEVFAMDNNVSSEMGVFKNEPIVVCTVEENKSEFSPEEMNLASQPYYMFKINDDLKDEIVEKENISVFVKTNCKEQYDYFWRMNKLGLVYFGTFSAILIVLEVVVLVLVVRSEFDLNKEELCIKKVLGYNLMSRYGEVVVETLISSVICFGLSVLALSRFDTKVPFISAIIIGLVLLVEEFIIIVCYAIRLEKRNIQKILKGGAL